MSPNTDLLGWALERASGTRYADLVSQLLWAPMGAQRDAYITVDRLGAPRAVFITLGGMALTLVLWPLGASVLWVQALVLVPWALGCFSANSAQQARLVHMAPALAPATVALNTSAIYGGQALGAALGGGLIAHGLMRQLHWFGLVLMLAAMALSWQAARVQRRSPAIAAAPHTA